jgi:ribosomal-protein-alanine N-acetyltransferase
MLRAAQGAHRARRCDESQRLVLENALSGRNHPRRQADFRGPICGSYGCAASSKYRGADLHCGMGPFPIITDRLVLREFRREDDLAVDAFASDAEVTLHTSWGPNDLQTTRLVLQQWVAEQAMWPRSSIPLAIELGANQELIGSTGFASIENSTGIFGFVLRKDHWGNGFATEASQALIRFGFGHLGLHRVAAECFVEQTASIRVFQKLGMRREAHFVRNAWKSGVWRDAYSYALLSDEWAHGPDVHVVLAAASDPGLQSSTPGKALELVEIGALKGNEGDQEYALPAHIDLTRYNTIAIYCERFRAVFGTAKLDAF